MLRRYALLSIFVAGCGTADPPQQQPSAYRRAIEWWAGVDPKVCPGRGIPGAVQRANGTWACATSPAVRIHPDAQPFGPAVPPSGDAPGIHVSIPKVTVFEVTPMQIGGGK